MKKIEEYQGMPLPFWGISSITAITILAFVYLLFAINENKINNRKIKYLKEKTHIYKLDNRLDAYFIGSSLTRRAMMTFNSLENSIIKNNKKFNYKLVVCPGFSLEEFNFKIKEIEKLRPKYLFIESNIACINMEGNFLVKFRERLSIIPLRLFNMDKTDVMAEFYIITHNDDLLESMLKINNYNFNPGDRFKIRKVNEFSTWIKFFKEAKNLGIEVYLLDFPRSFEADKGLPINMKEQYNSLISEYLSEHSVGYIDFPKKISQKEYYIDRAHFNKLGADYYCDWLVKELFERELLK